MKINKYFHKNNIFFKNLLTKAELCDIILLEIININNLFNLITINVIIIL